MNKFKVTQPSSFLLVGSSGSGKTILVLDIIKNRDRIFENKISKIVYCYQVYQDIFNDYPEINFHKGMLSNPEKMFPNTGQSYILVLDDMLSEMDKQGDLISKFFTVYSHHLKINIFLLSQNLFFQSKFSRTITLNTHYIFLYQNRRDKNQIRRFMQQLYPSKADVLMEIYNDATKGQYTYLCIDLSPNNEEPFILRRNILPDEIEHIYIPTSA